MELGSPHGTLGNLPDEEVDASDVAVWIDPLDATKEFTGYSLLTTHFNKWMFGMVKSPEVDEIRRSFSLN